MQKNAAAFFTQPPKPGDSSSAASIEQLWGEHLRVWEYYEYYEYYAGKNSIKSADSSLAARVVRKSPYQSVSVRTAAINRAAGLAPTTGGKHRPTSPTVPRTGTKKTLPLARERFLILS